ncbi:hypothetical protein DFH94DRAFT_785847 [Russula ochroleuca]|uniref:Uncharacterized protein n=1 Tax=Russula ochroleuca TaxID=152965 RepID=A0A9P5JU39_9AGAM|nr:hypothetical protein DFH94DRAFT_785847 [Russula ochroleuca]
MCTVSRWRRECQLLISGSFGTPGILERSGIRAKAVPEGICEKQRDDLPGIGENYQDTRCDFPQR